MTIQAQIETFTAAELPAAVNIEALRCYLNFMAAEIGAVGARNLDDAADVLGGLCRSQNLFLHRGGHHLAVHLFSGHWTRLLFVTEGGQ
jgi:hypothetical protein